MKTLPISLLLCGLSASLSMADAGDWMSVQGLLQQADGLSYADGEYTLCFSLYTEATGGDSIWEECKSVPVEDGLYHAVIGDTKPLPAPSLRANWMGIAIDGTALSGRLPVTGGNRAARAQHAVLSDTALYSQSAALSDTSGYSRLSGLAGQAQRALRSDSAVYSDTALYSQSASLAQDSVADGARLGTGVAVRSINGLRDEVVLAAAGSVSLSVRGDTLRLVGRDAFDSTAQAQLLEAKTWIRSHENAFLEASGEFTVKFMPSHHNNNGYFTTPTCTSVNEGELYYYGRVGTGNACGLRLCVYTGDASNPYVWKAFSMQ